MSKSKLATFLLNPYSIPPKTLILITAIQCTTVVALYVIAAVQDHRLEVLYRESAEELKFDKHADQAVNLTK